MRDDWDRHWQDYHEAAAQNPANAWRRAVIFSTLADEAGAGPMRLADIGCGQGDLLGAARTAFAQAELLGIDASAAGLEISSRKVPGARFVQHDLTRAGGLPAGIDRWATHAVCSEVLEHVDDPVAFLGNAAALLAPGGKLVITVPGGPMSAFDRHIGHRRHYTTALLGEVVAGAGLRARWIRGAGFPFFNLYRLLLVARGRRLIGDLDGRGPLPRSARVAMAAFGWLFRFNLDAPRLGWQIVGLAERQMRNPAVAPSS